MSEIVGATAIYKELEKRQEKLPTVKILTGIIEEIIPEASTLLNRISDTYLEYTLHEKTHSLNVLDNMGRIIPKETLEQMNELELTILILSAFLHDIGMAVARQKKARILGSREFMDFKEECPRVNRSLRMARKESSSRIADQIEDQLLTMYLRASHATSGAKFIKEKYGDRLKYKDLKFSELVCTVCKSHGEPWAKLWVRREHIQGRRLSEDYPTGLSFGNLEVNIQYLAIVLRLADILDFDRERTPSILFEYLHPIGDTSLKHWMAHLSVQGWSIRKDRIRYRVQCEHPLYQKTVYEIMDRIDDELRGATLLLEKFPKETGEKYGIQLPNAVGRSEIEPKLVEGKPSYIYGDFQFGLDYDRVIALLGEELQYEDIAAIRELLQNSVDACKHRAALEKALGTSWNGNQSKIQFEYDTKTKRLVVEDNGIGMDARIIHNHFLKVGCSYFSQDNPRYLHDIALFKDKGVTLYPISKFGIGILSCFMLASRIEVRTRRKEYEKLCCPLDVSINPRLKMYVIRELSPSDWGQGKGPGTRIILHLEKPIDLKKAVADFAINLEFNILVTIDGVSNIIKPRGFDIDSFPEKRKEIRAHIKAGRLKSVEIDLSQSGVKGLRGKTTLLFPSVREKAVIPTHDKIKVQSIGLEEASFGEYSRYGKQEDTITTCEGIHVPKGVSISLPFVHLTMIDFFGASRPELTLNRREIKKKMKPTTEKLRDFLSTTFRKEIQSGKLDFHSPFWKFLWATKDYLQDFFLRDLKARTELFELPLLNKGQRRMFTYEEIVKRFQGVCIVFPRYLMDGKTPSLYGNYSVSPSDLPLLAVATKFGYKGLPHFWRNLFDWSKLSLVEKDEYYYLKVRLQYHLDPILDKMKKKLLQLYRLEPGEYPRFAEYDGIPPNTLYSNNAALALNAKHPIANLFLSCLDEARSMKETSLVKEFANFLGGIPLEMADLQSGKSLGLKLKKQGLISSPKVKLFKAESIGVRNVFELERFFISPPPGIYKY